MKKLGFVCPWSNDRRKSWSGTNWGLFTALKKHYEIIDIDTGQRSFFDRLKRKLKKLMGYPPDMALSHMKSLEKKVEKLLSQENYPLFQFEELPCTYDGAQYIYMDLHSRYIEQLFDNDRNIFLLSDRRSVPENFIRERADYQDEFLLHVSGVFTMGHWLQKELEENYECLKNKVFHVGGGINLDRTRIDDGQKTGNKILFVGRDFERKNGPLVLKAFAKARAARPDIQLYIAGVQREKFKYSVSEGVIILGDLTSDKLVDYFNLCDIFCMPSVIEPYGLVFPEALSYGLPCIGRDAFEMPYFIEDGVTGYLTKNDSVDELSQYMLDLLQNDSIKENVRSNREWYLKEYSWETVASRIAQVIG